MWDSHFSQYSPVFYLHRIRYLKRNKSLLWKSSSDQPIGHFLVPPRIPVNHANQCHTLDFAAIRSGFATHQRRASLSFSSHPRTTIRFKSLLNMTWTCVKKFGVKVFLASTSPQWRSFARTPASVPGFHSTRPNFVLRLYSIKRVAISVSEYPFRYR